MTVSLPSMTAVPGNSSDIILLTNQIAEEVSTWRLDSLTQKKSGTLRSSPGPHHMRAAPMFRCERMLHFLLQTWP
jgi:hypothetical protein